MERAREQAVVPRVRPTDTQQDTARVLSSHTVWRFTLTTCPPSSIVFTLATLPERMASRKSWSASTRSCSSAESVWALLDGMRIGTDWDTATGRGAMMAGAQLL